MKKVLALILLVCTVSCGPTRHAVSVEMRHPSKAGVELTGKNVSVVYLENDNETATGFNESMADGFAYALEQEYGRTGGNIGVYRMRHIPGANYAAKDSLFNILMDTGADLVFLFDTVNVDTPPVNLQLYCLDGMNQVDKVQKFVGSLMSNPDDGWDSGIRVAEPFMPQWKHEQYSILYFDSVKWYDALLKAENYDWKGAMDVWISLLDSGDLLKRSAASYNISVACFMLGDYPLATAWLDRSDADNKLPLSDALRKRIEIRMK